MSTTSTHSSVASSSPSPSPLTTSPSGSVSRGLDSNFYNKPPLPYATGATFTAHRHIPPAPFGHAYPSAWSPFKTESFRRLTQTAYCVSRPPLPGVTLPESRRLSITETLRTGFSCGAQIVVAEGGVVAKIYDPLYEDGFDAEGNKRDVVVLAEGDYAREAAAYQELQLQGHVGVAGCVPAYHGSWTIDVPTIFDGKTHTRQVRLILMGHVVGAVMSSLEPTLLDQQSRWHVMQAVLEAEARIFAKGVEHADLATRNVVVVSLDTASPPSPSTHTSMPAPALARDPQVCIIDFNVSVVRRLGIRCFSDPDPAFFARVEQKWPHRILGPITRFWDQMQEFEVRGWVPNGLEEANEWLWERFRGRAEYVLVVWEGEGRPRIGWGGGADTEGVPRESFGEGKDGEDEVVFRGRGEWG